jgi:hypothetical protein
MTKPWCAETPLELQGIRGDRVLPQQQNHPSSEADDARPVEVSGATKSQRRTATTPPGVNFHHQMTHGDSQMDAIETASQ